jgi:hypothetical protein
VTPGKRRNPFPPVESGRKTVLYTRRLVVWVFQSTVDGTWIIDAAKRGYGQWEKGDHFLWPEVFDP